MKMMDLLTVLSVVITCAATAASAAFLCWYTRLTGQLLKVQKSVNDPFVFLTFDLSPNGRKGSVYLRNSGGTPTLDVVVITDESNGVPRGDHFRRLYRCDLLSPREGLHLIEEVEVDRIPNDLMFKIHYRNVAGEACTASAPMILNRALDTYFRWDFPQRFPWGDEKR